MFRVSNRPFSRRRVDVLALWLSLVLPNVRPKAPALQPSPRGRARSLAVTGVAECTAEGAANVLVENRRIPRWGCPRSLPSNSHRHGSARPGSVRSEPLSCDYELNYDDEFMQEQLQ